MPKQLNPVSEEKLIMLIDDDIDDRYLFSRAAKLENPEIKCITAEGGKEAFELLHTISPLPQVIFLDINMPKLNGWEIIRQFKKDEQLKHIPILIFSTSSHEKDVLAARQAGAIGYCTKPLDFDGLQTILHFICTNLGPGLSEAIRNNKYITYFKTSERSV